MAKKNSKPKRRRGQAVVPDEQKVHVWTLAAEDWSLREIAKEVGLAPSTVHNILKSDPDRLAGLIDQQKRLRADQWKQIENRGQTMLLDMMKRAGTILGVGDGDTKAANMPTDTEDYFIQHGRPWAAVIRLAAEGAANKHQLLTGQPTERTENTNTMVLRDMTDEDVIRYAYREGAQDDLPGSLKRKAVAMIAAGTLDSSSPGGDDPEP